MSQTWYDDLKPAGAAGTHAAGDDGEDINTPDNTALSFPEAGQVIDASYHVYGGQVVVHMPEGYDEYWIHLNKIFVSPGEQIDPNEIIGTSGGGVGDDVLHNGVVQPAQAQSWYEGHSSGYHSEIGYFQDATPQGSMSEFNKGWHHPARQLDPRPIITRLKALAPQLFSGPNAGGSNNPGVPVTGTTGTPTQGTPLAFGLPDPQQFAAGAVTGISQTLGFSDPKNALLRISVGAVGVVLMLGSLVIALQPELTDAGEAMQSGVDQVKQQVVGAAKDAVAAT